MRESGPAARRTSGPAGSSVAGGRGVRPARTPGRPDRQVRFGPRVVLTKQEAFTACQALADAGRALVRSGGADEADALCSLFALLEERLVMTCPT